MNGGASREGEISVAMGGLSRAGDELQVVLGALLERLEKACRPSIPMPACGGTAAPEIAPTAPLACVITVEAAKLAACVSRMQNVLSRLEL